MHAEIFILRVQWLSELYSPNEFLNHLIIIPEDPPLLL